jgi:hypothetical protein
VNVYLPKLFQHPLMVGRRPVNAAALRAPEKMLLSGKDVRRYQRFDRLLGFGLQDGVALQAAREKSGAHGQATFFDNLTQLVRILVTFDENKSRRLLLFEPAVAGENQPIFLPRRVNQAVPGQMPPINNVQA